MSRDIPERGQPGVSDSEGIDALVAQAASGDEKAWAELIGQYSRRVYALSRSRLHDPHIAEEITQSVFVTVFQQLTSGRYQAENKFEAWLFRIAMNRVRDHVRRTSRLPSHVSEKAILEARSSNKWYQNGDESDRLRGAIQTLPESDQEILMLRHQAGMEFKAISSVLDEPVGTLLARHHRALGKLRKLLDPASVTENAS